MTGKAAGGMTSDGLPGAGLRLKGAIMRHLSRLDDGDMVRWTFRGLLAGALVMLALDLLELSEQNGWTAPHATSPERRSDPVLPPAVETEFERQAVDPSRFVTTDAESLARPMQFELRPGGVMSAEGSIEEGTAERFAIEIAERGEYVKTLSLNSPGGALDDAMTMARLVRERGIGTEVEDGALCASSCPLLLAGGETRRAGSKAAIGVHQFYATANSSSGPEQAMSDAQSTTARIARHLTALGIDPAVWLHALDTPPRALYYFTPEELEKYRLVTAPSVAANR
jgi:hypothetical protein